MKIDALMYFSTLTCKNLIMLLDSLDQNKIMQNVFDSKLLQNLSMKFECEVWVNATECTYLPLRLESNVGCRGEMEQGTVQEQKAFIHSHMLERKHFLLSEP